MVNLIDSRWDENMKLHLQLKMELQMNYYLGLMKELSWFIQLLPTQDLIRENFMVELLASHWDKKTELQWDLQNRDRFFSWLL